MLSQGHMGAPLYLIVTLAKLAQDLGSHITNPDMDCIKLEIATFKFGE